MQLEFVISDGNNGETVYGLSKIIRVADLPKTQFATSHNTIHVATIRRLRVISRRKTSGFNLSVESNSNSMSSRHKPDL